METLDKDIQSAILTKWHDGKDIALFVIYGITEEKPKKELLRYMNDNTDLNKGDIIAFVENWRIKRGLVQQK